MPRSERSRRWIAATVATIVVAGVVSWALASRTGSSQGGLASNRKAPSHRALRGKDAHPPARGSGSSSTTQPSLSAQANPLGPNVVQYLSSRTGTVLAAVEDLTTNQIWSIGQGSPQAEASIVKLDILETLLEQRQSAGQTLTTDDESLTQSMVEDSDNDAATDLWDEVGSAPGIQAFNSEVGLEDTTPSPCVVCAGFPWPGWGLTTTTPADQIALLREVVLPNSLLTPANRNYALQLLENVTPDQRWGVTGGVPPEVTVALKNGWLPLNNSDTDWQINSIGWVSGAGRDYLLAVLTTGNPTESYGIETIDQLSSSVWQTMGE